ncbi:MAG: proline--tRNA ligase [Candidatus Kerfeldbacteria bacterium RIFCSPHIGHO2_02_FULL_42_14]|uniref:Proline--tRNA ligase n=1 Tax=Candidatus Kerfeldbacteria bacterium RIFCSPHIGHO2_02_FULL_42_14 TaxID=1798540 RepID=A0A1G2AR32_9BACT|nr:MAG: proline--tRNA ligase [Candidatus Kerfeldbacteria bacterium RIFCSPHIGHO2_02_FULL_42_14]OGY80653.1 MAG: proline--tRNA ligase [Candidatus Kerfeldbacteria bacterium RIFCSPHIGHO2_12_FULL_42_13]OGY82578.1 MAG: proline--tRNA ligase [Candidatus Kerfeldbacteria bacterium RIFCSPLOWO2_02_FULL_42_19]OGY85181.1 MAG: proline--tRNA ligase [Candidatus Kerfeldbacteria bacterium RIFCSPLOWO2_12_FULL_43_9]
MKQSQLFGKTTKTIPKDIKLASHKFLYQGGFIRELTAGRYSYLPLGFRVWSRIVSIIDQEMQRIGAQRVLTPTLHPVELWKQGPRFAAWGPELMQVKDRRDTLFALGATHEEVFGDLVKKFSLSYKDLPCVVYQFTTKFRDELRPRGGLLRLREFTMKDAYSFHVTAASLDATYRAMYAAYEKCMQRFGLDYIVVEADSGAIGGKHSHEFMALSSVGEDIVLRCPSCGYAANQEKAQFFREPLNLSEKLGKLHKVQARGLVTIEKMSQHYKAPRAQMLKSVVYVADEKFVGAVLRGDLEVNEIKFKNVLQARTLRQATEVEITSLGTVRGFIAPIDLKNVLWIGDPSVETVRNFYTGANVVDVDFANINFPRDFQVSRLTDIAQAQAGYACHVCHAQLQALRAIEFGHIFKLDHYYSVPLDVNFVDAQGNVKPLFMGSYGIGIDRAVATIVEQHHDAAGIVWPAAVAPYQVHLVNLVTDHTAADALYDALQAKGIQVLYDDRQISSGSKLKDTDLLGMPWRIIVSSRLASGQFELKNRSSKAVVKGNLAFILKQLS